MEEVWQRVELVISVSGGRMISRENLEFMFEKYELTPEEREQILQRCRDRGIRVFAESTAKAAAKVEPEHEETTEAEAAEEQKTGRKSFLSRLFGR